MKKPNRSIHHADFASSSLADLEEFLRFSGRLAAEDTICSSKSQELSDYALNAWLQQGSSGCRFAQGRARHADKSGIVHVTVWVPLAEAFEQLEVLLRNSTDADIEAFYFSFPCEAGANLVPELLGLVDASPDWELREIQADEPVGDGNVDVGVRWLHPSGLWESWALLFWSDESQPRTRWSPFPILTLRTGPPKRAKKRANCADLADMSLQAAEQNHFEYFVEQSGLLKQRILAGELEGSARARVSLRAPSAQVEPLDLPCTSH